VRGANSLDMEDIEDMAKSSPAGFHPRELRSSVAFSSRKIAKKLSTPSIPEFSKAPGIEINASGGEQAGVGVPGVEVGSFLRDLHSLVSRWYIQLPGRSSHT
jgi:hypothetical protein